MMKISVIFGGSKIDSRIETLELSQKNSNQRGNFLKKNLINSFHLSAEENVILEQFAA